MSSKTPDSLEMTHLVTRMLKQTYSDVLVNSRGEGPGEEAFVVVTLINSWAEYVTYEIRVNTRPTR